MSRTGSGRTPEGPGRGHAISGPATLAHGLPGPASMLALCLALGLAQAGAHAADPQRGAEIYRSHCAGCHGVGGRPVLPGAPDFSRPTALLKPDPALLETIRSGRGGMPAYAGQLRDREILDLISHLRTLR